MNIKYIYVDFERISYTVGSVENADQLKNVGKCSTCPTIKG